MRAKAAATRGTARDSGHRDAAMLLRGAGRGDSRGRGDTPRRRSWEKWCARASSGAGRQPPRAPPRRTLTPSSGWYLAQVWAPGAPSPGPWGAQLRGPGRPRTFPIPALRRTAPRPGEDAGGAGRAVSVLPARGAGCAGGGWGGPFRVAPGQRLRCISAPMSQREGDDPEPHTASHPCGGGR